MSQDVGAWLRRRRDEVPPAFRPWIRSGTWEDRPGNLVDALTDRGVESLHDAMRGDGKGRETAFRLLAADAFLTYACEASLETEDVVGTLARIVARVADQDPSSTAPPTDS